MGPRLVMGLHRGATDAGVPCSSGVICTWGRLWFRESRLLGYPAVTTPFTHEAKAHRVSNASVLIAQRRFCQFGTLMYQLVRENYHIYFGVSTYQHTTLLMIFSRLWSHHEHSIVPADANSLSEATVWHGIETPKAVRPEVLALPTALVTTQVTEAGTFIDIACQQPGRSVRGDYPRLGVCCHAILGIRPHRSPAQLPADLAGRAPTSRA